VNPLALFALRALLLGGLAAGALCFVRFDTLWVWVILILHLAAQLGNLLAIGWRRTGPWEGEDDAS
jgi:hypothetical protein